MVNNLYSRLQSLIFWNTLEQRLNFFNIKIKMNDQTQLVAFVLKDIIFSFVLRSSFILLFVVFPMMYLYRNADFYQEYNLSCQIYNMLFFMLGILGPIQHLYVLDTDVCDDYWAVNMIRADIKKYYKKKLIYKLFVYEIGLLLILGILVFLNLLQFQHMVFIVLITTIFRIVEEYLGLKVFAFKKVSLINYMGNSLFHFIWTFLGFGIYLLVLAFPVFQYVFGYHYVTIFSLTDMSILILIVLTITLMCAVYGMANYDFSLIRKYYLVAQNYYSSMQFSFKGNRSYSIDSHEKVISIRNFNISKFYFVFLWRFKQVLLNCMFKTITKSVCVLFVWIFFNRIFDNEYLTLLAIFSFLFYCVEGKTISNLITENINEPLNAFKIFKIKRIMKKRNLYNTLIVYVLNSFVYIFLILFVSLIDPIGSEWLWYGILTLLFIVRLSITLFREKLIYFVRK